MVVQQVVHIDAQKSNWEPIQEIVPFSSIPAATASPATASASVAEQPQKIATTSQ